MTPHVIRANVPLRGAAPNGIIHVHSEPQAGRGPGYSRRGNHSPRLCSKTVRAGFLAHGSSVIRPLSWAPWWAGDLHVGASPSRVIHTSLSGVLTASAALLVPITSLPPFPRQHIHERSSRRWLLRESHPVAHPVDTCSAARLRSVCLHPPCITPGGCAVLNRPWCARESAPG